MSEIHAGVRFDTEGTECVACKKSFGVLRAKSNCKVKMSLIFDTKISSLCTGTIDLDVQWSTI